MNQTIDIPADTTVIMPARKGGLNITPEDFEIVLQEKYTPAQAEPVRYWYYEARDKGWSLTDLNRHTGCSTTSLSRIFRGLYDADPNKLCLDLAKAREMRMQSTENPEFIHTSLAARLFAIFDKTRAMGTTSIVWGKMGIGKTTIIKEYQRLNNHGKTITVRCPAAATLGKFTYAIGRACGLAAGSFNYLQLKDKILTILSMGKRLILIDELHQLFLTSTPDSAIRCCEFLRELADVSECGLVLIGTDALPEHIFKGPHKAALEQLVDRGTLQISLPPKATKQDLLKFLQAYGLSMPAEKTDPEALSILGDIITSAGLRKLTLHLRDGAAYAARKEEAYTWSHFVSAHEAIQTLSK